MADIALYIYMITESADNEIEIDVPQDISGILKAFGVRFMIKNGTFRKDHRIYDCCKQI